MVMDSMARIPDSGSLVAAETQTLESDLVADETQMLQFDSAAAESRTEDSQVADDIRMQRLDYAAAAEIQTLQLDADETKPLDFAAPPLAIEDDYVA
jgi:hypothetical protein